MPTGMNYARARDMMVDCQLRTNSVTDLRVLGAMGSIPRERFVPAGRRSLAYSDEDLRISDGSETPRYLMEPVSQGRLIQLADIGPDELVLVVGCGYGYSCAVVAQLAGAVVGVEESEEMVSQGSEELLALDIGNAALVAGPLAKGCPGEGPYDVILLEGAIEDIPGEIVEQLKDGGRLVTVRGLGRAGSAMSYTKIDGALRGTSVFNCAVMPLPGFEKAPAFVF